MLLAKLKTTAMAGVLLALFLGLGGFVPKGSDTSIAPSSWGRQPREMPRV